jgi:hypothetical protein
MSQKLASTKNVQLTENFRICSFVNEKELTADESVIFVQSCYVFINNLAQLHLNSFSKKVSKVLFYHLIDLSIKLYLILYFPTKNAHLFESSRSVVSTMPCECVGKCWYFANRLMQAFEPISKIQQVFFFTQSIIIILIQILQFFII